MRMPRQQVEVFPDGAVKIYAAKDRRLGGLKISLRYQDQSVGVVRYYSAENSADGNRIDRVIKVPHTDKVNRMDIAVDQKDGRQYRITRIQAKPESGVDLYDLESVTVQIKEAT